MENLSCETEAWSNSETAYLTVFNWLNTDGNYTKFQWCIDCCCCFPSWCSPFLLLYCSVPLWWLGNLCCSSSKVPHTNCLVSFLVRREDNAPFLHVGGSFWSSVLTYLSEGERNARGCLSSFVRTWSSNTGVWSSTWKCVCSDTG